VNLGRSHKLHAAQIKPNHPQTIDSWQQDENSPDSFYCWYLVFINFMVLVERALENFWQGA